MVRLNSYHIAILLVVGLQLFLRCNLISSTKLKEDARLLRTSWFSPPSREAEPGPAARFTARRNEEPPVNVALPSPSAVAPTPLLPPLSQPRLPIGSMTTEHVAAASAPDPLGWLSARQTRERAVALSLGGICPALRSFSEHSNGMELLAFIKSYALYWPRHLGFENLTIVFDGESSSDRFEGAMLQAQYPFTRVRFEPLPNGRPLAEELPGRLRDVGYERQNIDTIRLDLHCEGAGVIVIFDADSPLVTPVTFLDLFDEAGRVVKRHALYDGFEGAVRRFLGLDDAGVGGNARQRYPSIGTAMLSFPNPFFASTLRLARERAMARWRVPDIYAAYRAVYAEDDGTHPSNFDLLSWSAYYFGERALYSWHMAAARNNDFTNPKFPSPSLPLLSWLPACAAGPRDAPIASCRHTPSKLLPWTENGVRAELDAPTRSGGDITWNAMAAPDDLNALWVLGLCYIRPAVSPLCASDFAATAAGPHLLTLTIDVNRPNEVTSDHLCRVAIHVCDVSLSPAQTYGATKLSHADEAPQLLYRSLPAQVLMRVNVSHLDTLCNVLAPYDILDEALSAEGRSRLPLTTHRGEYEGEWTEWPVGDEPPQMPL